MKRPPFIVFGLGAIAFMALVNAWAWPQLPADARVPIHFGVSGTPDGYADRTVGLLLLPAVAAGVLAILAVIPRLEPRRDHLERSMPAYTATAIAVMGLLAVVDVVAVRSALGSQVDVGIPISLGVGILFLVIGNYLGKVRSNFLFGIRTPWTLTSELSWSRTHRLGGRLFALCGLLLIVVSFLLPTAWRSAILIGSLLAIVVVPIVYSYGVWLADPRREPSP